MSDETEKFLTGPEVDKRYGRSSQSRWRWGKDAELGFPKPIKIRGRCFYRLREIEEWERMIATARSSPVSGHRRAGP